MLQKKDIYLKDFALVLGLGLTHVAAYAAKFAHHWAYNGGMLVMGWCYFVATVTLLYQSYSSQYVFYLVKSPADWARSLSLFGLFAMYLLGPLVQLFDFKLTDSEGVMSFCFLALGLIPFRYFWDGLWQENQLVSVSSEASELKQAA